MKKKLIILMMVVLMALGVVGCNAAGTGLLSELTKVNGWEAVESKGSATVEVIAGGSNISLAFDMTQYSNQKDMQASAEITFKKATMEGVSIDLTKGQFKISPVKMYVSKEAIYVNKSVITELCNLMDVKVPSEIANIKSEYIGLEVPQQEGTDTKVAVELAMKLLTDSKVELPVTQSGRAYSITLSDEQMVNVLFDLTKEILGNVDTLNKFSDTGLTQKDIEDNKESIDATLAEVKTMITPVIKGSKGEAKYTFADDKYTEEVSADFKVDLAGLTGAAEDKVSLKMKVTTEASKTTAKAVTVPKDATLFTEEDIVAMANPVTVVLSSEETITKNQVTYVPFKQVMNQFGIEVKYDSKTKKTYAIIGDQNVYVKTIIQKGVSYISLTDLASLGLTYEEAEGLIIIQ